MQINVTPFTVNVQPAVNDQVSTVKVEAVIDHPNDKVVRAFVSARGRTVPLDLWSGEAYDEAGQWTDAEAQARITALLGQANLAELFR